MKRIKELAVRLIAVVGAFNCAALLLAQQPTDPTAPAKPAVEAEEPGAEQATTQNSETNSTNDTGIHREAIVRMGSDVELKRGETADAVVVIGGSARIHGKVRDGVVVIGGDIEVDGEIGDAAVTVMGSIKARPGANIRGDIVVVGGRIDAADGVKLPRRPVEIDLPIVGEGARNWFLQCVLKLRPLAPQVGWVWAIAGIFFGIYLLVALVLPRPVQICLGELNRRPAITFFLGLLTKMLVPLVLGILAVTGIGLVVVPFIIAALLFGAIIGKVALFQWLGGGISHRFGRSGVPNPLLAFLIGILIITALYMVPVIGLITFGLVSLWGLGCAASATFGSMRREMPEKGPTQPPPAVPSPAMATASVPGMGVGLAGGSGAGSNPAAEQPREFSSGPGLANAPTLQGVPETLAYPKASFWERVGAAFLDLVLVSVLGGLLGRPAFAFLVAIAYFTGMWAWKGTTIGGIVLGLKVVRLDGQPLTFTVALVRALATAFAATIFFLGILWIAWDRDKQGWHDKIAGTVVLRLPRGTPLVCL
jgi:uncharacterized RDD family membrane protein YckC